MPRYMHVCICSRAPLHRRRDNERRYYSVASTRHVNLVLLHGMVYCLLYCMAWYIAWLSVVLWCFLLVSCFSCWSCVTSLLALVGLVSPSVLCWFLVFCSVLRYLLVGPCRYCAAFLRVLVCLLSCFSLFVSAVLCVGLLFFLFKNPSAAAHAAPPAGASAVYLPLLLDLPLLRLTASPPFAAARRIWEGEFGAK